MAATNSIMMPLGTIAPDFRLLDTVTDSVMNLDGLKGRRGTLIMFICNHCPYVIHIKAQLIALA
ncbi:MAG: thioredoxin family protein, partial [Methylococcales bacterium]